MHLTRAGETASSRGGDPLTGIGLLGAADVASFLAVRRQPFTSSKGRTRGALAILALWLALAATSRMATVRPGRSGVRISSRALGLLCGLANVALFVVHLRIQKGRLRSVPGGFLGAAALVCAVHQKDNP